MVFSPFFLLLTHLLWNNFSSCHLCCVFTAFSFNTHTQSVFTSLLWAGSWKSAHRDYSSLLPCATEVNRPQHKHRGFSKVQIAGSKLKSLGILYRERKSFSCLFRVHLESPRTLVLLRFTWAKCHHKTYKHVWLSAEQIKIFCVCVWLQLQEQEQTSW